MTNVFFYDKKLQNEKFFLSKLNFPFFTLIVYLIGLELAGAFLKDSNTFQDYTNQTFNVRTLRQLDQIRRCDFNCINGRCNPVTRNCVCNIGWKGGACDICSEGRICDWSVLRPQLLFILPQAGVDYDNSKQSKYVYAHGRGFLRGRNSRYSCIFGNIVTIGRWISNAVVECAKPLRAHAGKYIFNLLPFASKINIPHKPGYLQYFTFYTPCNETLCEGYCLGPLCLCQSAKSGQQCEVSIPNVSPSSLAVAVQTVEFQKFTFKIPTESDSSRLTAMSTEISNFVIDPFEHSATWLEPIGRSLKRPYSVNIIIDNSNSKILMKWSITVVPSFAAILEEIVGCKRGSFVTNQMFVRGKIQSISLNENSGKFHWSNATLKSLINKTVPLKINVYDNTTRLLIESYLINVNIENVYSEESQLFRFTLYPYAIQVPLLITALHSGLKNDDLSIEILKKNFLNLVEYPLQVTAKEQNVILKNQHNLMQEYITTTNCKKHWEIEVIEPRDIILVKAFNSTLADVLVVRFGLLLRLVFKCLRHSTVITQSILPTELNGVVKLNPPSIFTTAPLEWEANEVFTIDIESENFGFEKFDKSIWMSANFSPFNLVWSQLNDMQINRFKTRLWLTLEASKTSKTLKTLSSQIYLPNSLNPVISIPYQIVKAEDIYADNEFTLTLNCLTDNLGPDLSYLENFNELVDVELYSTNRAQNFFKTVHLNMKTKFFPIRSELFQLRIKSIEFKPLEILIKITPNNRTLTLELERFPVQQIVFDETEVNVLNLRKFHDKSESTDDKMADIHYTIPTLTIRPSVFSISESFARKTFFADFIYENGPFGSFATVLINQTNNFEYGRFGKAVKWSQFTATIPLKTIPAMCVGCGFRLPIKFEKMIQSENKHLVDFEDKNCNINYVQISFQYTIKNIAKSFQSQAIVLVDTRKTEGVLNVKKPVICKEVDSNQDPTKMLNPTERTQLLQSCPTTKLQNCQKLYQPAAVCGKYWRNIPDDVMSIETFAQFLMLAVNCRLSGINFVVMRRFISCILSVDFDCPSSFPKDASLPLINTNLNNGKLFNQFDKIPQFKLGIQTMFPALSAVEAQLMNFPQLLHNFLFQLESVVSNSELSAITEKSDSKWFNNFLKTIAEQSESGEKITENELHDFQDWKKGKTLVERWNKILNDLQGNNFDLQFPQLKASLQQFAELVHCADHLKSITRQFGADNPFLMLHDIMHKMFSSLKSSSNSKTSGQHPDNVIAEAFVRFLPQQIVEGEELQIFVTITNTMRESDLRNIHIDLDFGREFIGVNRILENALKHRIGPVFYSGISSLDANNILAPNSTLQAQWTIVPVPEFRLIRTITQTPQIVVSFEYMGKRKLQRLRSPNFNIVAKSSLRVLAFAFPTIFHEGSTQQIAPFSVNFAIINSGYSKLKNVELIELRTLMLSSTAKSTRVDYKLSGVEMQGRRFNQSSSWNVGEIESGKHHHLTFNLSTMNNEEGLIKNLSVLALANGKILSLFDYRFFFIHDTVANRFNKFLVSESHQPYPLYFYTKKDSKLTLVDTLQIVQIKTSDQEIEGHNFLSIFVVYERLGSSRNLASKKKKGKSSPVYGALSVNAKEYFRNDQNLSKLVRITEIIKGDGVLQRQINDENVWIDWASSDKKTKIIKFVDLYANQQSNQIFYELLFGNPQFFQIPYFPQDAYHIPILPLAFKSIQFNESRAENKNNEELRGIIIYQMRGVSPLKSMLNYTLLSPENHSQVQIISDTGEIILLGTPNFNANNLKSYCTNVLVSDIDGRHATVPVQFTTSQNQTFKNNCKLFPASTAVYRHEFLSDRSSLKQINELLKEQQIIQNIERFENQKLVNNQNTTVFPTNVADKENELIVTTVIVNTINSDLILPTRLPKISAPINIKSTQVILTKNKIPEAETVEKVNKNVGTNKNNKTAILGKLIDIVYPLSTIPSTIPHTPESNSNYVSLLPEIFNNKKQSKVNGRYELETSAQNLIITPDALLQFQTTTLSLKVSTINSIETADDRRYTLATALPAVDLLNNLQTTKVAVYGKFGRNQTIGKESVFVNDILKKNESAGNIVIYQVCQKRNKKPIWSLICDLKKTVHKV